MRQHAAVEGRWGRQAALYDRHRMSRFNSDNLARQAPCTPRWRSKKDPTGETRPLL